MIVQGYVPSVESDGLRVQQMFVRWLFITTEKRNAWHSTLSLKNWPLFLDLESAKHHAERHRKLGSYFGIHETVVCEFRTVAGSLLWGHHPAWRMPFALWGEEPPERRPRAAATRLRVGVSIGDLREATRVGWGWRDQTGYAEKTGWVSAEELATLESTRHCEQGQVGRVFDSVAPGSSDLLMGWQEATYRSLRPVPDAALRLLELFSMQSSPEADPPMPYWPERSTPPSRIALHRIVTKRGMPSLEIGPVICQKCFTTISASGECLCPE